MMKEKTVMAAVVLSFLVGSINLPAQDLDTKANERERRVVKVLRTSNKAQVNQYVPLAFEMKNVNPFAVVRFIRRPMEIEEGNWWTFVHPDGDKGRVLLNVPIWMVEPMTELMARIDQPGLTTSSGDKRTIYMMKHRDPSDPGIAAGLAGYLTDGEIIPDVAIGGLYVIDVPSGFASSLEALEKVIDKPVDQALIKITVYEIDVNDDGTIGLDFHAWKNGPGRNLASFGTNNQMTHLNGRDGSPGVFNPGPAVTAAGLPAHYRGRGYEASYYIDVPSAYLDYLAVKGKARILTAPRATVRHGESALFFVGDQIPYYRTRNGASPIGGARPAAMSNDALGDSGNYPDNRTVSGEVMERETSVAEVGMEMAVHPVIGQESVNLEFDITLTNHTGFDDEGVPQLSTRKVDTEVRLAPGAEQIIGGLNRTQQIQTTRKVPILGSIPILGWAFGSEITQSKKTMLAIVVSADKIDDDSGVGSSEQEIIDSIENPGMEAVKTPDTLVGFDMPLLDSHSN